MEINPTVKFAKVVAGRRHVIALDVNGTIWAWGSNVYGQIGNGRTGNDSISHNSGSDPIQTIPVKIQEDITFEKIYASYYNSAAIDIEGNLYVWGEDSCTQGINDGAFKIYDSALISTMYLKTTPLLINEGTKYTDVVLFNNSIIVKDENGKLYGCGKNDIGQLGNQTTNDEEKFISIANELNFVCIGGGYNHFLGIDSTGTLWGWGYNGNGQLGNDSTQNSITPIRIRVTGVSFVDIAKSTANSSFVFDTNGDLWAWGGELEDIGAGSSSTYQKTPIQITGKKQLYTVTFMNGTETVKTETVEEGSAATAPELTKAGYTLTWAPDFSNVTSDLTVRAIWTANTNTPYKVEHYLRTTDIEVEGYELQETENLSRNYRFCSCGNTKNLYRIYRKYKL